MSVLGKLHVGLSFFEVKANDLGNSMMPHLWLPNGDCDGEGYFQRANGSGSKQVQYVYSDSNSVASGAPVTYDLRGSLASILDGVTTSFATVVGIALRNKSSTTAEYLTLGAGSNPWITWLNATGDAVRIGPGGFFVLESPIDGYASTAGTADIVQIAAATGTISFDIAIWGR